MTILCDLLYMCISLFFFFKQKTAYEMRVSDWSSDVCSSDLFTGRGSKPACRPRTPCILDAYHLSGTRASRTVFPRGDLGDGATAGAPAGRSEERRVGKACVSTCRSRWSPYH